MWSFNLKVPCYHPSLVDVERRSMDGSAGRVDPVKVPCGSCLGCRTSLARQWAIRISHEQVFRPPALFLTLTYDDSHLPDNGSLDADAFQKWLKRFRRRIGERVSYFGCGEYGEKGERPHYHAVVCGYDFPDRVLVGNRDGYPVWSSGVLESSWRYGFSELTPSSYKAAAYVAGYVRKKVKKKRDSDHYLRVDKTTGEVVELEQEFQRSSRRPALGLEWLRKYWTDVYPRDFVVMNGREYKPPVYYDRKMEEISPEIMEEVRYQRWKDAEEIGDPKLIMKEKIHRARVGLFNRRDKL